MSTLAFSRRRFLASVACALAPTPLLAQELPPGRTPGVEAPQEQILAALARLDSIVEDIQIRSGVPGLAVGVVYQGETVYAKGFGVKSVDEEGEVTPGTVFQLASVSKSIGATVVARQVSRGVVSWDSRMKKLLPWFSLSDPGVSARLTVGDLYSHRSGLPAHAGDDLEDIGYGRQTILERLRLQPLTPFRASYAYTNFGMTAAAEAVAQASGTSWSDLAEEAIFAPLGMDSSSARFADFMAEEDRAVPHYRTEGGFAPLFQRQPDAQSPAGGMSASVNDMAKWMKMVLAGGGELLSPEALRPALSPQSFSHRPGSPDERAGFYGYGFEINVEPSGRVRLSHSGAFVSGAGTCFSLIPSLELGIVVLSNAAPVGAVEAIAASFMELAQTGEINRDWISGYGPLFLPFYKTLGHTAGEPFPAAPAPAPAPAYFEGRYGHPYFGEVEVRREGDELILFVGPKEMPLPLEHWDGSVMVFDLTNENAPLGSRSTAAFSGGAEQAEFLEVELFVKDGPARFRRL